MSAPLASLAGLSYWYPGEIPALVDVNLELEPGLTLVTGPSGGGKSSLLRLFNGLIPHFHGGRIGGTATVFGHDVSRTATRVLARDVGFVFQDPERQVVYGSVEREVAFGLENLGVDRREMVRRVGMALERLALSDLRGRRVGTLSGGERQRVAIASVLAMEPRLVVLDEPTSELDPAGVAAVLEACLDLEGRGIAVLIAEHRLERLVPAAGSFIGVAGGRVDAHAARPILAGPPARLRPVPARDAHNDRDGAAAWWTNGLVAGPTGIPLVACGSLGGQSGEVIALTGANGSGKTTLLRTIAGLLPPLSGSIARQPGRTAYLPQDPGALLHRPSLLAEVVWTLERASAGNADHRFEVAGRAALAEFGLAELADRDPRDLSAGERQRGALAVILAGNPAIALLDEPTRGMDELARRSLARVLDRLRGDGCSVVVATHDEDLVAEIADRVLLIKDGTITEAEPAAAAARTDVPVLAARAS